jgi:hypothetical protein
MLNKATGLIGLYDTKISFYVNCCDTHVMRSCQKENEPYACFM